MPTVPDIFWQESTLTERLKWYVATQGEDNVDALSPDIIQALYANSAREDMYGYYEGMLTDEEWLDFADLAAAAGFDKDGSGAETAILGKYYLMLKTIIMDGPERFREMAYFSQVGNITTFSDEPGAFEKHLLQLAKNNVLVSAEYMFTCVAEIMSNRAFATQMIHVLPDEEAMRAARVWMLLFSVYVEHKKLPIGLLSKTTYGPEDFERLRDDLKSVNWDDDYNNECISMHREKRTVSA